MKKVYLITNIEQYAMLIAYCVEHDISVFRTFWNEREKGNRCYYVNFKDKRCLYSSKEYWLKEGYEIVVPEFYFDEYGCVRIRS